MIGIEPILFLDLDLILERQSAAAQNIRRQADLAGDRHFTSKGRLVDMHGVGDLQIACRQTRNLVDSIDGNVADSFDERHMTNANSRPDLNETLLAVAPHGNVIRISRRRSRLPGKDGAQSSNTGAELTRYAPLRKVRLQENGVLHTGGWNGRQVVNLYGRGS